MRLLFFLIVVLNVGLFAYGQGFFGTPPSEAGRSRAQRAPLNADLVTVGEPVLAPHTKS